MENNIKCEGRKEHQNQQEYQTQIKCFYTPLEDENEDIKTLQEILNPYAIPVKLEQLTREGNRKLIYQGEEMTKAFNFLTIPRVEGTAARLILYLQQCICSLSNCASNTENKKALEITLVMKSIYQEEDDISNIHTQAVEDVTSKIKQSLHNVEGLTVK
jgi:hypothetical protein